MVGLPGCGRGGGGGRGGCKGSGVEQGGGWMEWRTRRTQNELEHRV